MSSSTLLVVYNADAGLGAALIHTVHRLVSPATYPCSLCALTHGAMGQRPAWTHFLEELRRGSPPTEVEVHHRDDAARTMWDGLPLPTVLERHGSAVRVVLGPAEIAACADIPSLIQAIVDARRMSGSPA